MGSELVARSLCFGFDSSLEPLFRDLDFHVPTGWVGVVGPNGSGKTTLLLLACGLLEPTGGLIRRPGKAAYCPQRTDEAPEALARLLSSSEPASVQSRVRLGVQDDWLERWVTLSHGERKRAQIAVALAAEPELLAVDEPTNHLDGQAREALGDALSSYRGVGLLVSHDRELLDRLCSSCLFLHPPPPVLRPGGYTAGSAEAAKERIGRRRLYLHATSSAERIRREAIRRREAASRADRRRSKRHLAIHDSDAKEKIDRARVTGKDGQAGRLARQIEGRSRRAEDTRRESYAPAERELKFWLPGSVYRGDAVARLEGGEIELGPARALRYPELVVRGAERVALCGPNGSGKSTLVHRILARLTLPAERVVSMPQEIAAADSLSLAESVRSLSRAELGHLMTVVADLGSEPRRLLDTKLPSPGETRKLLLALGVIREPWLVVMDEPTNHLDLPSIELLGRALSSCPCALLLVSHDERFLDDVGCGRWRIGREGNGYRLALCRARG